MTGLILRFVVLTPAELSRIAILGLGGFVIVRPFLPFAVPFSWLVLELLIAFLFGTLCDPLQSWSDYIAN